MNNERARLRRLAFKNSRIDTITGRQCNLCRIPFQSGEQHLKVENTVWHTQCFKCSQCFCDLIDKVHFHQDGRNYCQYDFEVNYAPICAKCGLSVLNGHVVRAATGNFHSECFVCDECEGNLEDGMWIVNGLMLCYPCKEDKRKVAHYICIKCKQSIDGPELLKVNNDFFHGYHFDCKDCSTPLDCTGRQLKTDFFCARCYDMRCEICPDCKKPIDPQEERSVLALGKHWHVDHFRCAKCAIAFRGSAFFTRNGRAYCKEDYCELFGEYCFICSKGLTGESIRIFEKGWCKECYRCRGCSRQLEAKDKVSEEDMLPLCKKCVSQKNFKKILDERVHEQRELEKTTKRLQKMKTVG